MENPWSEPWLAGMVARPTESTLIVVNICSRIGKRGDSMGLREGWDTTVHACAQRLGVSPATLETALIGVGLAATVALLPPAAKKAAFVIMGRIALDIAQGQGLHAAARGAIGLSVRQAAIEQFAQRATRAITQH
jgi:hypothetical protein